MYKVIACGIFKPYIEKFDIEKDQYQFVYLQVQQHNYPQKLSRLIQNEIDISKGVDKIIVLYGICGGALLSICSRDIPVVVVKVHDCMSILLGSKQKYEQLTNNNKSIRWSCYSLKQENYTNDNLHDWEEKYDQETIEYLKSVLLPETDVYISFHWPEEKKYVINEKRIIDGSLTFLKDILSLTSQDIETIYPSQTMKFSFDEDLITIL